jgi:glutamate/tyrosine decarboxylase-like PLP-dependent enzyme
LTDHLLRLPEQEMRRLGYRAVDAIVDHLVRLRDERVTNVRSYEETVAAIGGFADAPVPAGEVLDLVCREILPVNTHVDHPRFFAFVPGPSNFVGVIADTLAAGHNVFAGHWLAASGAGAVEVETVAWLCRECGLPDAAGGLFVSGGSMANLTGLAVARRVALGGPDDRGVIYGSAQMHHSLAKGVRVLGFRDAQLRTVATDDRLRIDLAALRAAIAEDRAAGRRPFCVIASAGTTNTGAVDPLDRLADLCAQEQLWLHVDGAYGAAAVVSERARPLLAGLGRADSITLDPHKWLFQPYEIGCLLVRDVRLLRQTFALHPDDHGEYMGDVDRAGGRAAFYEHGVQLTRSFRALKLWMTVKVFGLRAVRDAIARGMELAEATEALLRADGRFEVVTPAQLGIVTFVPRPDEGRPDAPGFIAAVVEGLMADGFALATSTYVHGRDVLRMCTIHPESTVEDVRATVDRIADVVARVRESADRAPSERTRARA